MQRNKKAIMPAILFVLVTLLAACGGPGPGTNPTATSATTPTGPARRPPAQQILRYPMSQTSDLQTMDPALDQDTASDFAIKAVFTGLVEFNDQAQVVNELASSHQVSSDGLTYTFNIKSNAKFSDGTAVTADDVAFSIDRTMQPATKSAVASYMSLLKDYDKLIHGKVSTLIGDSIIVVDPHTIKLIISKPAAYFLSTMTYSSWYTVEKKLVLKYMSNWTDHLAEGGGAGPYMVQSWNHNKGVDMVPDPYWYGSAPKIQHLEYYQSGDFDTTYRAYQANQFDYATVPPAQLASAKSSPEFHEFPNLVTTYLAMNYLTKPFDNIKIRQAFALAINRDVLASTLLKGSVSPCWCFVPPGMPGHSNIIGPDNVTSTAGDQTKARQLFQQGLSEEHYTSASALPPIKLTYYASSATVTQYVSAIAQMWKLTLGISITTQTLDFPKLNETVTSTQDNPNGLQMWRASWQADYTDPQDWLSVFFLPKADNNDTNYGQNTSQAASEQQQVQQALQRADIDQNSTSRLSTYEDAEQKIINDVGLIPLWQPKNQVMIKPYVYGIVLNGLNIIPPDDWANIYLTQ